MSANFQPLRVTPLSPLKTNKRTGIRLPRLQNYKTPRLESSLNNSVELPQIKRFKTPSPVHGHFSVDLRHDEPPDLEKVNELEMNLWNVYKKLEFLEDLPEAISQYWSKMDDQFLSSIEDFFKDPRSKQLIKVSFIFEFGAIWVLHFSSQNIVIWNFMLSNLKNLIYQVHQNLLKIIEYILARIIPSKNPIISELQSKLFNNKQRNTKNRDFLTHIKHQSDGVFNLIKTIVKGINVEQNQTNQLMRILINQDKFTVEKARKLICKLGKEENTPRNQPLLPKAEDGVYTLVVDLDETLVHFTERGNQGVLLLRPYATHFLDELSKWYDLVVFTAGVQDYADWAIDTVDVNKSVKHRLYRQHAIPTGPIYIKDLRKLGRPLNKVLIIDNLPANFQLQPNNGIPIKTWLGDSADTELLVLIDPLISKSYLELAKNKTPDLRNKIYT